MPFGECSREPCTYYEGNFSPWQGLSEHYPLETQRSLIHYAHHKWQKTIF